VCDHYPAVEFLPVTVSILLLYLALAFACACSGLLCAPRVVSGGSTENSSGSGVKGGSVSRRCERLLVMVGG
jgi:hypothetical protein